MKKIVAIFFLLILLVPTVCLAAGAVMVNHVTAEKIECTQGKGCFVTGPVSVMFGLPSGVSVGNLKFTTLDQLMFMVGTYNTEQKIIEDVTGQVVASAKHPVATVKTNQEVRHLSTDWNFVAKMGMYTYQVVVNNEVLAIYKMRVVTAN